MAEPMLPDADARRRAATDFATNLVVLAGAGTGKTSLLVERALNAIGSGTAEMREIGAITFTEKAAGEMRERLALGLEGLRALARGEATPQLHDEAGRAYLWLKGRPGFSGEQTAARALEALEQLDAGTVTTIHGFCAELLRSHPVEAGVDPGFVVDTGEHAALLLDTTWRSFLHRELGREAARPELWTQLLSQVPLQAVAELARQASGFQVPPRLLAAPWDGLAAPEALKLPAGELAGRIEGFLEQQVGLSRTPLAYLQAAAQLLETLERRGVQEFRDRLRGLPDLRARIEAKKAPDPNKKLDSTLRAQAKRLLEEARALLGDLWEMDDETASTLFEATSPCIAEFREQLLRLGYISFDGLLSLARDLLRDHPEVREQLKRRYRLLLVDEFQDTDPLQYEIVLFLTEVTGESAAEPFAARLAAGRLFVVGDAKQSIYRFRGADFAAYGRAVKRILDCDGAELSLVANFRSVPEVTEPINRLFQAPDGCWVPSRYQPDYVAIESSRERAGGAPRVELWTVQSSEGVLDADRGREAEGRLIAGEIERWVREGRFRYRGITLLFRSLTNLSAYLRPLRELGIPFVVGGGREFLDRPEVTQLLATFGTLARPADQPALLAFLRSPAGAVSDVELAAYARDRGAWNWSATVDAGRFPEIARCFESLRELDRELGDLPADAAFRRVLEHTLMLPLGAAAFEGAQRVANLQKLTAAAGELARDGRLSFAEVVSALERGDLEQVKTDQPLSDDAAEAVRISTMHGMKGLESDCIVLPDLARRPGRSRQKPTVALTRLPDGRTALALKVTGSPNSPRVWHDLEDRRHGESEEVRVLYVALTRAREQLVLFARKSRERAPVLEALAPWGYDVDAPPEEGQRIADGQVLHRLFEPPPRKRRDRAQPLPTCAEAVAAYESAVSAWRERSRAPFTAPSAAHDAPAVPRGSGDGAAAAEESAVVVGRLMHRLLEIWDGEDRAELDRLLVRLAREEARKEGLEAARIEMQARKIAEAFLQSDLARRLRSRKKLGREVPLLLREADGRLYRGSIDLLYEDGDGTIVVADYKTDHETREIALRERYGEQLRVYAEAARKALDLKRGPRRELWMLRSGRRIVLD